MVRRDWTKLGEGEKIGRHDAEASSAGDLLDLGEKAEEGDMKEEYWALEREDPDVFASSRGPRTGKIEPCDGSYTTSSKEAGKLWGFRGAPIIGRESWSDGGLGEDACSTLCCTTGRNPNPRMLKAPKSKILKAIGQSLRRFRRYRGTENRGVGKKD